MAFLIRLLHVTSVAIILGGALLLFLMLGRRNRHVATLLDLMRTYEWLSWGAIGLTIMTGLGNLGHLGAGIPTADTSWGRRLTVKLLLVLAFVTFSALRTLVFGLTAVEARRQEIPASVWRNLHGLYGATVVLIAGIMGVAVFLSHF